MYKRIFRGEDKLWEEDVRLQNKVKQIFTEKKLQIWNEVVEKARKGIGYLLAGERKARRKH